MMAPYKCLGCVWSCNLETQGTEQKRAQLCGPGPAALLQLPERPWRSPLLSAHAYSPYLWRGRRTDDYQGLLQFYNRQYFRYPFSADNVKRLIQITPTWSMFLIGSHQCLHPQAPEYASFVTKDQFASRVRKKNCDQWIRVLSYFCFYFEA